MTSLLERRYRRVLRLLPVGYRRAWEEDMVSTFLARASEQGVRGPSLAERVSVVALAARLWLGGGRPVGEVRPWHRVLSRVALLALLYLALQGITVIVSSIRWTIAFAAGELMFRGSPAEFVATRAVSALVGVLLMVAFWCFASGRFLAPRLIMLATLGVTAAVVLMMTVESVVSVIATGADALVILTPFAAIPFVAATAMLTVAVWAGSGPAPRRRLWLGGFATAAVVLTVTQVARVARPELNLPDLNVDALAQLALLAGMVGLLSMRAGRQRVDWLVALAVFAVALVVAPLLFEGSGPVLSEAILATSMDVALVVLALACAWRGWVVTRATRTAGG